MNLSVKLSHGTSGTICAIFERVLQVSPVGPDDDFFDLGGDSIMAVTLALEIEKATGVRLPITALFDAPTAAMLAQAVEELVTPPDTSLVLLKPGVGTPIFMPHGVGGALMYLVPLARRVDTPNPIYGIQARGLDGKEAPLDRIEDMARLYLPSIRRLQPKGPYILVGYSMGGLIALELAQLLVADGETIALLALLDTFVHPRYRSFDRWIRIWGRRTKHHVAALKRLSPRDALPYALDRARGFFNDLRLEGHALPGRRRAGEERLPESAIRMIDGTRLAAARYRPHFYPGPITFIVADVEYPDIVWGRFTRELTIHTVSGSHMDMIGTQADSVAATLSQCLRNAIGT